MLKSLFILIIFFLFSGLIAGKNDEIQNERAIPGRLGYPEVCVVRFGEMRIFFYMNEEKQQLTTEFAEDVNERMLHGMVKAELESPILEVTPVATIHIDPVKIENNQPIYVDQQGSELFISHAQKVKDLAERSLGIHLSALSQQMSMILNFDANKFHQDQCGVQYEFLKNHPKPIPEYTIYQDLTLFDWEMGQGTISGTIVEDQDSGDSFLLPLFSSEIVCNVYTEPAIYLGPDAAPEYPGASTLLPHSPIACIDRYGSMSCGSGKGKRISVAVRGLVPTEEIVSLEKRSKALPINRPAKTVSSEGAITLAYPNGILSKELINPPAFVSNQCVYIENNSNIEIYQIGSEGNEPYIHYIKNLFKIETPSSDASIRHIVKRDGGFTELSLEDLKIAEASKIIMINRSKIPKDNRWYSIAEDFTKQGLPWIQLYEFLPERAILISGEKLKDLALTPLEEIFFRDAKTDIAEDNPNVINDKIVTEIDFFVFK